MDQVSKQSDTELKVVKSVEKVIPLIQLVREKAVLQLQVDRLNERMAALDTLIQQAKDLGVVEK